MKLFGFKPENMKAKLLEDAQRRLIEAEHMESRWKHAANQAREEVARLTGQTGQENKLRDLAKQPSKEDIVRSLDKAVESGRNFIGAAKV